MDMKLVHNKSERQNSHAQRAALPDTIYSCLASNGIKCISDVRKYPPPLRSKIPEPALSFDILTQISRNFLGSLGTGIVAQCLQNFM